MKAVSPVTFWIMVYLLDWKPIYFVAYREERNSIRSVSLRDKNSPGMTRSMTGSTGKP